MNIIYFLDDWRGFGGAANNLLHQAYAMQLAGHLVRIVFPVSRDGRCSREAEARCRKYRLDFHKIPFSTATSLREINIYEAVEDSIGVESFLGDRAVDLVHSIQLNVAVELACRELDIRHVMSIYSIDAGEFKIPYVNVFPHFLICDSEFYCRIWEKGLGLKSECIRNCIDVPEKGKGMAAVRQGGAIEVLAVGHIYKAKNQMEAIKFIEKAVGDGIDVHLTLCGNDTGWYAEDCKEYVERKNLRKHVAFEGFVSDIFRFLEDADLFLCSSMRESFPFSVTESMMLGVPIITTCAGGIAELVKDKWNGYLVDGYGADGIYAKFREYLEDRRTGRIGEIVNHSFETYLRNNVPEVVAVQIEGFYMSAIQGEVHPESRPSVRRHELEEKLSSVKDMFIRNQNLFPDKGHIYSRLWYIYNLRESELGGKNMDVYIWGTGKLGQEAQLAVKIFMAKWEMKGYIDSYRKGTCGQYCIYGPEIISGIGKGLVIVASYEAADEIKLYLENKGKRYNEDFILMV